VPAEVLIVDDDPDIREILVELLESEGYAAVAVGNGREALERLRQQPPATCILLDLMMPVMDGFQFRSEQLQDPRLLSIPVVVISAGGRCQQAAKEMGAVGCVEKPLDLPLLFKLIRKACADSAMVT
jgi:CheY-like chemotaxis protein